MIYLAKSTQLQPVVIPAPASFDLAAPMSLLVTCEASRKSYALHLENVYISGDYIVASVLLPEGADRGEYAYVFTAGDEETTGILRVGDYETEAVEFNNVTIYDQFDN